MIKVPRNLLQSAPTQEIADYILRNFSMFEITEALAESLKKNDDSGKIAITPSQFNSYFKIVGVSKVLFEKEFRGRKPISPNPEDNVLFNNEEDENKL